MNRTYALVWNPSLAAWTVTDERARRRAKGAGAVLAAALLLPLTAIAADLPTGGNVVSGSGAINQPNAQQMVIDQASNKLAIDWQSFDIGTGNKVTFNQPGRDAIALNRVLGADGSKIMGQLDANGRVFLINPNGVLFGAGAQVNVGGLVASTLNISNSDFAAGNYKFKGDGSNASVINNGQITAADGGSIALLGGTVSNNGVIVANQGSVALAAGNAVTLDFAGDGLLNVQVDEAVVDALVANHQLIKADGGQVLLTANAGDALLKTVVNNTGVIEAHTLGEKDGKIVLLGSFDGGTVQMAGTLDASAPNGGDGGFIETSGAHVKVADGAKVTTQAASGKTGTWLIDPNDFTIAASDGDMTGAAVSTALQNNNFEIQTATQGTAGGNGDIHVNDAVTWNSANTLTLNAERNININAAITASGAGGKVALKYGQATDDGDGADYSIKAPINLQSGDNFSTQKGTSGPQITYTVVNDAAALQAMNNSLGSNYAVGSNIDLSSISNWVPVGNDSSGFSGQFAGLGHTLSNLTISRSSEEYVGLFGKTNNSVIRDIGLVGGNVTGAKLVGGLAGSNDNGATISNAYASGVEVMASGDYVGGLVGNNYGGRIINAYATGSVSGRYNVGGFAGGNDNSGTISNAYATGSIYGSSYIGGLVGYSLNGTINNAYATGSVYGNYSLGGLIGRNAGSISNAYATGSVSASGGNGGGLVGINEGGGTISNAYWDSISTGKSNALGIGSGAVTDISSNRYNHSSYNDLGTWALVTGTSNVYAASDSNGVQWIMIEGQTRPFLASEYSTSISNAHQLQLMAYDLGAHYTLAKDIDASATSGSNASDMWGTSGFVPVGDSTNKFGGQINGSGHAITGLTIDRSATDYVGLFGYTNSASRISDIGLVGGNVKGAGFVGGLVGYSAGGDISNAYTSDSVSGTDYVGGLVGDNQGGAISNAYATGTVTGRSSVGGLVGLNGEESTISNAYATGTVTGGRDYGGGLVGANNGNISNAYATGAVTGNRIVGGLVGYNYRGTINNAYATGAVTGSSSVGGLVGISNGTISSSFYATTDANGNPLSNEGTGNSNGTGKTWAELTLASTFTGWDIASTVGSDAIWRIYDGYSGPLLRSFLKAVTVTVDDVAGKTYDGTNSSVVGVSYSRSDNSASLLGSASYTSVATRNAGTYDLGLTGLYSNQQGYDITVAAGSYTIAKAALTITANNASKTYNGLAFSGGNGVSYSGFVNGEGAGVLGGTLTYGGSSQGAINAGTYGLNASGLTASNYAISYNAGSLNVAKAALTINGTTASDKTYDGTTNATVTSGSLSGFIGDETLSVSATGTFDSKNAGDRTVTADYSLANGSNGGLASNYSLASTTGLSATIAKAALTITGTTASDKTYDGTTNATVTAGSLSGLVGNETLSVSATGTFDSKNAGKRTVTADYSLSDGSNGGLASNYSLASSTGLGATIAKAALTITALDASKTFGQSIALTGYSASGLMGDDRISAVSLSSLGQPATAATGSYAIVASDAVGSALSNYDIDYQDGTLLVSPEPVATPSTANSQPYIGAIVANSQTVAAPESTSPASEPEVLNPKMLMTNPLAEVMNLQVINRGIRLPEGI